MKKKNLLFSVCLLLVLLCFFLLCTDIGHDLILRVFPSANLGENLILWHARQEEVLPADSLPLFEELCGSYVLSEVNSPDFSLSARELDAIRGLGIPLQLEVSPDGSARMNVFDLKTEMVCDADNMLLRTGQENLFFFYQDGRLTVVDGKEHMIFEKASPGEPAA